VVTYNLYVVGNSAYCVILSGENVSRYSNKIESDGHNNKYFSDLPNPTSWRKNSWHGYGMKKLRHCHPIICLRLVTDRNACASARAVKDDFDVVCRLLKFMRTPLRWRMNPQSARLCLTVPTVLLSTPVHALLSAR